MTSGPESRRAWLAKGGSALLLSTTATSAIATGVVSVAHALGRWRNASPAVSVSNCMASANGATLLAISRWLPSGRKGTRTRLVSINLSGMSLRAGPLPMTSAPQSIVSISGDQLLIVHDQRGATPLEWKDGQWTAGMRWTLPVQPGPISTIVDRCTLVTADVRFCGIDLEANHVRWSRNDLMPTCLATSPHGKLTCGLPNHEVVEIAAGSGKVIRTVRRCPDMATAIAVDPQNSRIACLSRSGQVEVCSLPECRLLWTRKAHGLIGLPFALRAVDPPPMLQFSPAGCELVTVAREREWVLAIWDSQTGERLQTLRGHDGPINGAAYLPDGTLLSWSSDGTLRQWDVFRGFARRTIYVQELLL